MTKIHFWHFLTLSFLLPHKHFFILISSPWKWWSFSVTLHPHQVQASLQAAESGGAAGSTSLPLKIAVCGQQNCLEDASQSPVQMFSLCLNGDVLKSFRLFDCGDSLFLRSSEATLFPHVRIGFPAGNVANESKGGGRLKTHLAKMATHCTKMTNSDKAVQKAYNYLLTWG